MRFGELRGLTSLPIHRVRDQFRYEEVMTVLPVREAVTTRDTLLVATRPALAMLLAVRVPQSHWMTRWASWGEVKIAIPEALPDQDDDDHWLVVTIGRQEFHARLQGDPGRRALRDFVVAYRMAHPTQVQR